MVSGGSVAADSVVDGVSAGDFSTFERPPSVVTGGPSQKGRVLESAAVATDLSPAFAEMAEESTSLLAFVLDADCAAGLSFDSVCCMASSVRSSSPR